MEENEEAIALSAYEELAEAFSEIAPSKAENAYIEQPAMRSEIGNVKSFKVFEIGCGPGILAEYLIDQGAKVVGFDVSPKMIALAKKRNKQNGIFFVADASFNLPLDSDQNEKFDLAVASLAIDYIKNWDILLSETYRLLKKNGRFIFTIQHPLASWNWYKPKTPFGVQLVESTWKGFTDHPVIVPDYYRSFAEVINPLVKAGFKIEKIEDLRPILALKSIDPFKYEKYNKLPSFMCVVVTK